MKVGFLKFIFIASFFGNLTFIMKAEGAGEEQIIDEPVSINYYDVKAKIVQEKSKLEVKCILKGKARFSNVSEIVLYITKAISPEIKELKVNEKKTSFTLKRKRLSIKIEPPLAKDEEFILNIEYEGKIRQNITKEFIYLRENWVPFLLKGYRKDSPIIKLSISVPKEWKVISTGKLLEVISNCEYTTYVWDNSYLNIPRPFPFVVISGKYHKESTFYNDKEINFYLFPNNLSKKLERLKVTKEILELYSSKFGEYPFSKLDIVERPYSILRPFFSSSASADPSIVMWGPLLFFISEDEFRYILAHEISHQWWLWSVDSGLLYNEALASYSEDLIAEYYYGKHGLNRSYNRHLRRYLATIRKRSDSPFISNKKIPPGIFYDKGAIILRMLSTILGKENFLTSLKTYVERYKGKRTCFLKDFKDICEEVSKQDLDWFFKQWFKTTGYCDFSVKSVKSKKIFDKYNTEISLKRDGEMVMPVNLLINLESGEKIRKSWDGKERERKLILETLSKVSSVKLDPENLIFDIDRINNNKPVKIKRRFAFDFKQETHFLYPMRPEYGLPYFRPLKEILDAQLITFGPIVDYNEIDGYLGGLNFEWRYLYKHGLKLRGFFGEKSTRLRYHFSYSSYPFYVKRRTTCGISIYDEEGIRGMNLHISDSFRDIIRVGLKLRKEELYSDNFKTILPEDKKRDNESIELSLSCPTIDGISERMNIYLSFEQGMKLFKGNYDYSKYFLNITPPPIPIDIGIKSALFTKFRLGIIQGKVPSLKQFRMGGLEVHQEEGDNCLRGYEENQFIGRKMALLNIEYQSKLSDNVVWSAGLDAGKVWESEGVKVGIGLGLRYSGPLLSSKRTVLRFDLGQALEKNTSPRIYLGFGHSF